VHVHLLDLHGEFAVADGVARVAKHAHLDDHDGGEHHGRHRDLPERAEAGEAGGCRRGG
jgi:hypothetical protein